MNADDTMRQAIYEEFEEVMSDPRYAPSPQDHEREIERLTSMVESNYRQLMQEQEWKERAAA